MLISVTTNPKEKMTGVGTDLLTLPRVKLIQTEQDVNMARNRLPLRQKASLQTPITIFFDH